MSIKFTTTEEELISVVPITQLQYRDGSRIRQLEGASLARDKFSLQMQGYVSHIKGLVELVPKDAPIEEQNY